MSVLIVLLLFASFLNCARAQMVTIAVVSDADDPSAPGRRQHINMTTKYMTDLYGLENITLTAIDLSSNETSDDICTMLTSVSIVILTTRRQEIVDQFRLISKKYSLPVIRIIFTPYAEPKGSLQAGTYYKEVYTASSVVYKTIPIILANANLGQSALTVVFDNINDDVETSWMSNFDGPRALQINFEAAGMDNASIAQHASQLMATSSMDNNVLFICNTSTVESYIKATSADFWNSTLTKWSVITKDITSFKCDDCENVRLLWARPYLYSENGTWTVTHQQIYTYIKENPYDLFENYTMPASQEVDIQVYVDITVNLINYIMAVQEWVAGPSAPAGAADGWPQGCKASVMATTWQNAPSLNDWFLTNGYVGQFGRYIIHDDQTYVQNLGVRIFQIARQADEPTNYFNKYVGNWSLSSGLETFYDNTVDVDPRTIDHYRFVTVVEPPFVQINEVTGALEGYSIELMEMVAQELNITYDLYLVPDGLYGTMDENGNFNGVVEEVSSGSAEMAIAPVSVVAEREYVVDFTVPYYDLMGLSILMRKPDLSYSLFKFMEVLEYTVWLSIMGSYLLTSVLLFLFERFSPYSLKNRRPDYRLDPEQREFTIKECLWFCLTSLTPQGGGEPPKQISGRVLAASWWLFGFIIVASYTANLAAFLTVSRLQQSITSLTDLANQFAVQYAPSKGSDAETYFRRMTEVENQFYDIWKNLALNQSIEPMERTKDAVWDYPVSERYKNMWQFMQKSDPPANLSVALSRILNDSDTDGGFAYLGNSIEVKYAAMTNCKLQEVGADFALRPIAFAVQTAHSLRDRVSQTILLLLSNRQLEVLKEKWWTDNPKKAICPTASTDDTDGIRVENIGGVFIIMAGGIVISLGMLVFEYAFSRGMQLRKSVNAANNKQLSPIPRLGRTREKTSDGFEMDEAPTVTTSSMNFSPEVESTSTTTRHRHGGNSRRSSMQQERDAVPQFAVSHAVV